MLPNTTLESARLFLNDPSSLLKCGLAGAVILGISIYVQRYRKAILLRLQRLRDESFLGSAWMIRGEIPNDGKRLFHLLQLNPDFVTAHSERWKFMSLGDYLSSLKPAIVPKDVDVPHWIQREMEATLTAALLSTLGPRFGALLLPTIGNSFIEKHLRKFAATAAGYWASSYQAPSLKSVAGNRVAVDSGGINISLFTLTAFANINEQSQLSKPTVSPLDLMRRGEVGYVPTFDQPNLVPNPFIVEQHWDRAIQGMEQMLQSEQQHIQSKSTPNEEKSCEPSEKYDPLDRSMPQPKPINDRILPGLHMGWGDAVSTHTKREILRNRLLAVLLNRLGYNYFLVEQRSLDTTFKVSLNGKLIVHPCELIQGLISCGHKVAVCPRATVTTFGMAMCIKENDDSWTNVPLGCFLQTGYEDNKKQPAYCYLPHGGIDLDIEGPLVGVDAMGAPNRCNIQHYMAIEGMCGWHSNHNVDVPWIQPINCGKEMTGDKARQAVRMAGLGAVVVNAVGTELELPFGGYGLTGVCNDTSALLDQALSGETSVYPLTSTGRFLMHQARRILKLRKNLEGKLNLMKELDDLDRLAHATIHIHSDLHASPSNCADSCRRFLHCIPPAMPFQLMVDSKETMEEIKQELEFLVK